MYTSYVFAPPARVAVAISGSEDRFPVRRIFCVGRNYADHVREMGGDPAREAPIFFTKPADAVVPGQAVVPYPPQTENLHHEVELVVAIHRGGVNIAAEQALQHVFGYAVGNDLTRRDLQHAYRDKGLPWDMSKAFDSSAQLGVICPAEKFGALGEQAIWLKVNGEFRQRSQLSKMIWSVTDIVSTLSTYVALQAGDLIYTGTPDGVGPLLHGDVVVAGIDGLEQLEFQLAKA
jgi:fumarylpyruvate hydrolase